MQDENKKIYNVTGMSCAACQVRVEKAVAGVDGVQDVSVSLLTNSMCVEGKAPVSAIIKAVKDSGYGASLKEGTQEDPLEDTETPKLKKRLVFSAVFLAVLMYVTMGHNMLEWPVPSFLEHDHLALTLTQMLLALIVMGINGKFFTSGFNALIHRAPNMDTLVALGSSVSFGWSLYVFYKMCGMITDGAQNAELMGLYHDQLYFESAAMIPALITVGKMLEAMSKGRTTNALKSLMKLAPKTAVIMKDGVETEVPVASVKVDDEFIVRPGCLIPVDGIVLSGASAVNESALTGESVPSDKSEGDAVSAGTMNTSGVLMCRAVKVGEDTTIAGIIKLVSDASATKAPIARIADRVSGVFVPAVILIAATVIAGWLISGQTVSWALARGISVLVISCPCALGLATPVAIMVGNGLGARSGILFKTGESLENAGKTQIVVLDKTGTITKGEPQVTDIFTCKGHTQDELLEKAFLLEHLSEHPLAGAVVSKALSEGISPSDQTVTGFNAVPGNGLSGTANGKLMHAGSAAFISSFCTIPEDINLNAGRAASEGKTPLYFEEEGQLIGMIAVADTIRDDSKKAIEELHRLGVRVVMVTGDNRETASAIGTEAGVDEIAAGIMPDGKEEIVRRLQKYGRVAMVGDGINDAPALTRADIGIAIGAGTDVAVDSADIVLMNSSLMDVAASLRLSRKTLKNIHENLFWAFFYNIICIPLAAGLFTVEMNPMIGAAAMSLSSFTVCMNALRLNLFRLRDPSKDRPLRNAIREEKLLDIDIENDRNGYGKGDDVMVKTVKIEGMMCAHCEATVKKALESLEFVSDAKVSHTDGTAVITVTEDYNADSVKKVIEDRDYRFLGIED